MVRLDFGQLEKSILAFSPPFQISQAFTVITMFRMVETITQGLTGQFGTQAAMPQPLAGTAGSHGTLSPEHFPLVGLAARAMRWLFPITCSAVSPAHPHQRLIHISLPDNYLEIQRCFRNEPAKTGKPSKHLCSEGLL
jgi:hypothetical protein